MLNSFIYFPAILFSCLTTELQTFKMTSHLKPLKHSYTTTNEIPLHDQKPQSILPMSFDELVVVMGGSGKAKTTWELLRLGIDPLDNESTQLSTKARGILQHAIGQNNSIICTSILSITNSDCGTKKYLQKLHDGQMIESVLIPAYKFSRTTLCVSTQVGCDRGCAFCATGKMGLLRNLTAEEILSQVIHGLKISRDENMPDMTNIVFMGMGDAGRNIEAVHSAVSALTDRNRFAMASSKITVSTVGPSPEIFMELAKIPATIAWSLHASEDRLRKLLVPSTRHTTVQLRDGLARALATRIALRTRTIMIAITLVAGINDSIEDALHLADFIRPLLDIAPKIALDLIPYNDIGVMGFNRPSDEKVNAFQSCLRAQGYICFVRVARGDDEASACGMLATKRVKSNTSNSTSSSTETIMDRIMVM